MAAPTQRDINKAVFRGLNLQGALSSSMVPGITFEPTVGIAASRIALLNLKLNSFRDPLTRAIKEVVIPSIQKNFDSGGRPEWEPLAEYTIQRRAGEGYHSDAPLVKTGALKATMQQESIWTITNTMAVLADLPPVVWYGKVQQGGYEGSGGGRRVRARGRKTLDVLEGITDKALAGGPGGNVIPPIPARPFVMLQPEDEDRITEIFVEWLGQKVMEAWPGVML